MINQKAAVTGGAGFIGSHLAEALAAQNFHVTIIDDLSSGKLENIKPLADKVQFVKGTVTDLPALRKLFRGVDYVFHMAAIASVPKSIKDPLTSHEVDVTGTMNVLLAAAENKAKKVILASSAAVYGDSPVSPKQEDMLPCPLSPYAVDKLAAENYCRVLGQLHDMPTVCLRYFNVYGPRQDPNSQYAAVIPKFITSVLAGQPPVIFGDGEQTRDFVYIKDVLNANILAARSNACGVFNISGGKSITLNELADLIIKLAGNRLKPIYQGARQGDIRHSLADISKAAAFGYEPHYSLSDGLAETLKWYQNK